MVEVEHLIKTYGTQQAVDDISFRADKGEIVGFLGPNGAGKSTTMKIALGYLPPTAGTVRIGGFDVQQDPLAVRRRVGYLPEHNPLYLDMYVHEYLEFIGSVHGLQGRELRQRVGLAQALVHDPEVLILDEPTTGLDPNQIGEIRQLIRELGEDKTVIFSTHILPEVTALCSRVVIISRGKLVADAPVAELAARAAGETVLRAEFEGAVATAPLAALPGVRGVEASGPGVVLIRTAPGTDVRAAVSRLAVEQGWLLLGLRQEQQTLEAVFGELTK